jgi:hypothetical protein
VEELNAQLAQYVALGSVEQVTTLRNECERLKAVIHHPFCLAFFNVQVLQKNEDELKKEQGRIQLITNRLSCLDDLQGKAKSLEQVKNPLRA